MKVFPRVSREQFDANTTNPITSEKHFTPAELAEAWNLSVGTIRTLFRKQERRGTGPRTSNPSVNSRNVSPKVEWGIHPI